jgi:nitrogen PTS system EIIA component
MAITIGPELHLSLIIPDLGHRRKDSALLEMTRRAQERGTVRDAELLRATLLLRERLGSTAVGRGVALPNARSLFVNEPGLVVGRSRRGIDWSAADGMPVQLVMLLLSPPDVPPDLHHEMLARVAAAVKPVRLRTRLLDAGDADAMAVRLREAMA